MVVPSVPDNGPGNREPEPNKGGEGGEGGEGDNSPESLAQARTPSSFNVNPEACSAGRGAKELPEIDLSELRRNGLGLLSIESDSFEADPFIPIREAIRLCVDEATGHMRVKLTLAGQMELCEGFFHATSGPLKGMFIVASATDVDEFICMIPPLERVESLRVQGSTHRGYFIEKFNRPQGQQACLLGIVHPNSEEVSYRLQVNRAGFRQLANNLQRAIAENLSQSNPETMLQSSFLLNAVNLELANWLKGQCASVGLARNLRAFLAAKFPYVESYLRGSIRYSDQETQLSLRLSVQLPKYYDRGAIFSDEVEDPTILDEREMIDDLKRRRAIDIPKDRGAKNFKVSKVFEVQVSHDLSTGLIAVSISPVDPEQHSVA